jgi:hypothetical protein
LQSGPLASPAAQDESESEPSQEAQEPNAGIHVIELKLKHLLSVEQTKPRPCGVSLHIAARSIPLRNASANGAGKSDQKQQHDRDP